MTIKVYGMLCPEIKALKQIRNTHVVYFKTALYYSDSIYEEGEVLGGEYLYSTMY